MSDPWTWPTVWGLTVGACCWLGREGQRKKNWDNCSRITIENFKRIFFKKVKKKE